MSIYLALTAFGVYLLNEKGEVLSEHLTYPDVEKSVENISSVDDGRVTEAVRAAAEMIDSAEGDEVILDHPMLVKCLGELTTKTLKVDEKAKEIQWFRTMETDHLIKTGIVESVETASSFRRKVALFVAKKALTAASEEKDVLIKTAIDGVGEIDKAINVLAMRLREWYSLHHPSLDPIIENHELYARVVYDGSGKSQLDELKLVQIGLTENLSKRVMDRVPSDIGAEFSKNDHTITTLLAEQVLQLYTLRKEMESYIEGLMNEIAPNITALAGHMVGARLISLAGSLKDLARKPSSTVQVFGAEKALFRSLKTGAAPPKHGVIYQVPEIHSAPYWQRGKIARALAGKLSIAARIDAYSDHDIGEKLRGQFERRLEEIKKQNPTEPPPKPKDAPKKRYKTARRQGDRRKRRRRDR